MVGRFADDPKRHAGDLEDDVNAKLEGNLDAHCYDIICFTQAELFYLGDDPDAALKGICPRFGIFRCLLPRRKKTTPPPTWPSWRTTSRRCTVGRPS